MASSFQGASNVNSFNTTNHTTINSGNNNSRAYYGTTQNTRYPDIPCRGADRAPSGSLGAQGYLPNRNPLFPPPSMHPAMMHLPPGSRTQNENSFNTRNETTNNSNNDNSAEYGIPSNRKSRKDGRRRGTHQEWDDEEEEEEAPQHFSNPVNNRNPGGQHPRYGPGALPSITNPHFAHGHFQHMGPAIQRQDEQLMRNVFERNVTEPAEEEGAEDSPSSTSSEEENPRMSINSGMADMSLNEDCPNFSRNKSDSQIPFPASHSENAAPPSRFEHVHPQSAPVLQQQPSFMPPNLGAPNWGPYPAYPPAAEARWNGQQQTATSSTSPLGQSSSSTAQQWLPAGTYALPYSNHWGAPQHNTYAAHPPPPPPPGPGFNTTHGYYNKGDQTVHSTNINSGNTHSVLIQDSYNNNSVRRYAPETDPFYCPSRRGLMLDFTFMAHPK